MRYLIFITFISIFNNSFGQPYRPDYVEIYDYQNVITDLRRYGKESKYYETLDYESMLYLDKVSFKTFLSINKDFLKEHNIDTSKIFFKVPKEFIKEFPVNYSNIKDFFASKNNWIFITRQVLIKNIGDNSDISISDKIYIKGDSIAICAFYVDTWSSKYRVVLTNRKLRFELLYQIQE